LCSVDLSGVVGAVEVAAGQYRRSGSWASRIRCASTPFASHRCRVVSETPEARAATFRYEPCSTAVRIASARRR
jgi:hypothetical protein